MALRSGTTTRKQRQPDAVVTETSSGQCCDASLDYEDLPVSLQDARWLALLEQAIKNIESPVYHKVTDDGGNVSWLLVKKRYWKLKSAREYAIMPKEKIHPAVLAELNCLLRNA